MLRLPVRDHFSQSLRGKAPAFDISKPCRQLHGQRFPRLLSQSINILRQFDLSNAVKTAARLP